MQYFKNIGKSCFKKIFKPHSKGFTLVELLIYSAIFTVVAGLLTGILIMISQTQTREIASFELTRQLQFVTQRIQYAIRDASVVEGVYEGDNPSAPCVTHCSIRLRTTDLTLDPTIISSDATGVYIQEGLGERTALTTANIRINALSFNKVRNPEGLVTVSMNLAMVANPDDPQFRIERRLASAVAHVSAAVFNSDLLPDAAGVRNVGGTILRWRDLILSGGINITGPESAGEQIGISMARGINHGASSISQYFITATPHNRFGQRYDIGGIPILHLEGDMGQTTRRAYFMNANVGIGTTAPTERLHVIGNVLAAAYFHTSDRNLKTDIRLLESNLSRILSLEAVSYKWKENGKQNIGLIAQDVEKVFPEIVSTSNQNQKAVDYAKIVAPLIGAIQEQQKEIQSLRERLERLEN